MIFLGYVDLPGVPVTVAKNRILVTAALPYANGRPHVGHIAGCYLPADIYVRYLKLAGREAYYICGSDEYGTPITVSALKEGVEPKAIIDRYHAVYISAFRDLGIDFSIYGRTSCEKHVVVTQQFFLRLHELGHVVKNSERRPYCSVCEMFLPDRYIEGTCYFDDCKIPGARGDQCEKCGRTIEAEKLIDPTCSICRMRGQGDGSIEIRDTDHWYLRLDAFQEELRAFIESHPEWRDQTKNFSYGLLNEGLRDRAITRDMSWGVPVPLEGAQGKVLYVWFDAPIGYITFSQQFFESEGAPDMWREFWMDDENGLVHFIGKDNTVFHTILFPGMMMAHGEYRMPDNVVVNEFLNLEGDKISTSRNYAVWVDEYLNGFEPDPLRYYLTAIAPETSDSDFSWKDYQARNNGELADNLGNFIQRNLSFCRKYFEGKVPPETHVSERGREMLHEIENARAEIADLLEDFRFKAALERLMLFSRRGNEFFSEEEPWKIRKSDLEACGGTIHVGLRVIEALSVFMAPFLPFAAAKLRAMLALPALEPGDWNTAPVLDAGHLIDEPKVLFQKIEDDRIDAQREALGAS